MIASQVCTIHNHSRGFENVGFALTTHLTSWLRLIVALPLGYSAVKLLLARGDHTVGRSPNAQRSM